MDLSLDPYKYWRDVESSWNSLALVAKKYLSAPLSSVESERLFATCGDLLSDKRMSISDEKFEKIVFLHHNLDILNFEY